MCGQYVTCRIHVAADKEFLFEFAVIYGAIFSKVYKICIGKQLSHFFEQLGMLIAITLGCIFALRQIDKEKLRIGLDCFKLLNNLSIVACKGFLIVLIVFQIDIGNFAKLNVFCVQFIYTECNGVCLTFLFFDHFPIFLA